MFEKMIDEMPLGHSHKHFQIVEDWWNTGIEPPEYRGKLNGVYKSSKPKVAMCQKRALAKMLQIADKPKAPRRDVEIFKTSPFDEAKEALSFLGMGGIYANAYTGVCREDTTAMKGLREWQNNHKTFLLLCGKTGAGKTFAGIVGMVDGMQRINNTLNWNGVCVKDHQLADMVALTMTSVAEKNELYRKPHLMIDDLRHGTKITDAFQTLVLNIVSERYNNRRKTIITTNATLHQFFMAYGDQVRRRILEDGKVIELI